MRKLGMLVLLFVLAGCAGKQAKIAAVLTAPAGTKPVVAAQLEKGNGLFAARDWAGAEQAFRQTIAAEPTLAEAHYNLALTLEQTGNGPEAKKHYIEAANLAPGNKVIWSSPPLQSKQGPLDYNIEKKSYLDPSTRGF